MKYMYNRCEVLVWLSQKVQVEKQQKKIEVITLIEQSLTVTLIKQSTFHPYF